MKEQENIIEHGNGTDTHDFDGMLETDRIWITCASGAKLFAEVNPDPAGYKEIFISLLTKEGVRQDLAIIGERFDSSPDCDVIPLAGEYSVKVYSDETSDDWTDEFRIKEIKRIN